MERKKVVAFYAFFLFGTNPELTMPKNIKALARCDFTSDDNL